MTRAAAAIAAAAVLFPLLSAVPSATAARQLASTALQRAFADAAAQYHVPQSVLLGVSYLQSRWDTHGGAPSVSGGYGPMHLTDVRTALAHAGPASDGPEDPRGDGARTATWVHEDLPEPGELPARLRTLEKAARLTDLDAAELRTDPAANVRGGAALLAATQRTLGLPLSADPAVWYGAVARYSGAEDTATASAYANEVFSVMRGGERRTTDSGQRVVLSAAPKLAAETGQLRRLHLRTTDPGRAECPPALACEWIPAPYEQVGDDDYGNHDKADRPRSQKIEYIVVHDTEATWDTTLGLVQDPTYVSWQYSLRSSDGHIAQHVPLRDVAWHAGNWYMNAKSVGLEHEGFLADPDAWYTEAMYRASARLVRYLALRYGIPLDRRHIIGHDNVPGPTTATIRGMHTDPGPYWDWAHYFRLLGAPFHATAGPDGGLVTILPDYAENQPEYTDCTERGEPCAPHGSGAVRLYTAPSESAALVKDIGLHPDGGDSATGVNDTGARASTGQQYAVAERKGDWTAIWYLGQKAWFHNSPKQPTAVDAKGLVITPKAGLADIPVYGRAYPEQEAYPEGIPAQAVSPLPYKLLAGQEYATSGRPVRGEYYWATTFDTENHTVVRGDQRYYEIQFGHRVAYVKADDVTVRPSGN